jgi:tetratricopeptide (TPR) repeat protein
MIVKRFPLLVQVILLLIPRYYWIFLLLGLFLRVVGGEAIHFSNVLIQVFLALFFVKIGVVIHEAGHLIFGKISGSTPKRMVLGRGHEVLRTDLLGITLIMHARPEGGLAFSTLEKTDKVKWRRAVRVMGGAGSNLLVALLVYAGFGFDYEFISAKEVIDPASAWIGANLLLAFLSMIPFYISYQGVKIPTDGMILIKLPFTPIIASEISANDLFEAYEFYEQKDYTKAEQLYLQCLAKDPTQEVLYLSLGAIVMKTGRYEEALNYHRKLEVNIDSKSLKAYKPLLFNNLAWIFLLLSDLEKADNYSELACRLNPKENIFKSTRGCVLIERGQINAGIDLISPMMDLRYVNPQTLTIAMYLMYAYHVRNEGKAKEKYRDFLQKNEAKLAQDDALLYQRILSRMDEEALVANG